MRVADYSLDSGISYGIIMTVKDEGTVGSHLTERKTEMGSANQPKGRKPNHKGERYVPYALPPSWIKDDVARARQTARGLKKVKS